MSNYVVYADVLLVLNFLLDFFLLWATGRFLRLKPKAWRLLLAALIGSLYGVCVIVPELTFLYPIWLKLLFSLALVRIAFPFGSWRRFLQATGAFYLISFAMSGAVLGGSAFFSNGLNLGSESYIRWGALFFAVFAAVIIASWGIRKISQNWRQENFQTKLEIWAGGRSCFLPALIDTGNTLSDPLSGRPVIVGEYRQLASLLPQGLRRSFELYAEKDPSQVLQNAQIDGWEKRLRLIPFSSIGRNHGLLLGFKPDKVIIHGQEKLETNQVIICLYQKSMAGDKKYQAIINPEIMEFTVPLAQ